MKACATAVTDGMRRFAGSLYPAVQEIFPKDTGVFLEYSGKAER
jgi:hypothetical protein